MRSDGDILIRAKLETKEFDKQINRVISEIQDIEYELKNADKNKLTSREVEDYEAKLEKANNQLKTLVKQKEKANQTPIDTKQNLNDIGNGMSSIIKKVAKWGLAVFSVRSAYLFVRSSVATISKYDEQLGANIEYIRYALAMAIKPIIEWIVNAVYTLMQYVAYIVKAWFNIDLFANASAKNFNKANGNAKKLQRTMASFDEMNVLSSNKDSGGVGTNLDLSKTLKDVEIPGWIKWIADNKDTILKVAGAIAGLFVISKITSLFGPLSKLGSLLGMGGLLGSLTAIASLATIVITITYLVKDIDKTKKEIEGLYDTHKKHNKQYIKDQKDVNKLINEQNVMMDSFTKSLHDNEEGLALTHTWFNKITGLSESEMKNARNSVSYTKDRVEQMQKLTREQGVEYETGVKILASLYDSVRINMALQQGLDKNSKKYKEIEDINKQTIAYMGEIITNLQQQGYSYDEIAKKLGLTKELVKNIAGKYQATIDVQTKMPTQQQQAKTISEWWSNFKKAFTNTINLGKQGIQLLFGNLFGGGKALGGVVKFASGGIINAPGRGVPVAGERGMEGIVPMTHQDQMELLGQTIAKYMVIDLTNITTLDGRVLARQVSKVQANNNFATNR